MCDACSVDVLVVDEPLIDVEPLVVNMLVEVPFVSVVLVVSVPFTVMVVVEASAFIITVLNVGNKHNEKITTADKTKCARFIFVSYCYQILI